MNVPQISKDFLKLALPAKSSYRHGFKLIAKSNLRGTLVILTEQVAKSSGRVQVAIRPYLLGFDLKAADKEAAAKAYADLGKWLLMAARLLKITTPSPTKKIKLVGTRTLNFLHFMEHSTELLGLLTDPDGPRMHDVEKVVVLPKQGGIKAMRVVHTINDEEHEKITRQHLEHITKLVASLVDLYWRLSLDIFGKAPAEFLSEAHSLVIKQHKDKNTPKKILSAKSDVVFTAGPNSTAALDNPKAPTKAAKKASAVKPTKAPKPAVKVIVKAKKGVIKTDLSKLKKK